MANLNNSLAFLATMAKLAITDPVTADDNADKSINKYLEQLFSNDTYLKENAVANAWKANTDYAIGDVAYSKNARSYMRLDCISSGKSGANEPNWNAAGVGVTVIDGACQWKIHDVKDTLPVGAIIPFPMAAIPAGYLRCNGQAVGRATYPELFAAIGTTYGAGDGSTTFNLPDLRGEFIRGFDDGRGVDSGRTLGSGQADGIKAHQHPLQGFTGGTASAPTLNTHVGLAVAPGDGGAVYTDRQAVNTNNGSARIVAYISDPNLGTETRPRNVAMQFCIKAFGATTNPGLIDVTQFANDVAAKVNLSDFTGTNQSKAANGWQKLPGGLILQWGAGGVTPPPIGYITFPITFPSACLCVQLTDLSATNQQYQTAEAGYVTTSNFLVRSNLSAGSDGFYWFAIGY